MTEEDIPPEWMWSFDEALREWFEERKAEKNEPKQEDDREQVPLMQNELSRRPQ